MPLSPGTRLGPYEIVAPLGEGGMGEVWKARDTRIDRTVALKVVKADFSERFEREARAVAALNHPNICTLYDVGPNFIVMEMIEGESPKGPLPLETALSCARQIADALEAAHEKGIVHRDLKPANIKIKPDGTVKVLDFGLAKTMESATGDPQSSPTLTISATRAGMIMGTAAYMSPEQARGKPVDKRADIWSFGVVVYEMLTGKLLFGGADLTETLASVVKDTPDLSAAPPQVRRLLARCLEKDPRKRLRDIGDVWLLLEEPSSAPAAPKRTAKWVWVACSLLAAAALAGWLRPTPPRNDRPAVTLSILPPAGVPLGGLGRDIELSPDGSVLFYSAADGHSYLRRLNSLQAQAFPGQLTNPPFWSPDSTTMAYPFQRQFMKVRIPDGAPEQIATLANPSRGGSWSGDGLVLISEIGRIVSVPAAGGDLKTVEMPPALQGGSTFYPEFLPGGRDFLFLHAPSRDPSDTTVYLATFRDGKVSDAVPLLKNETAAHFSLADGGHLLFVRNDNLYSQKLDRRARKLEGEAALAVQGVASLPTKSAHLSAFSVAANGTIAWRPGKAAASEVTEFDRSGNRRSTSGPPGSYENLVLSPDERQLQVSSWLVEVGQSGRSELPRDVLWFGWGAGGSTLIGARNQTVVDMPVSGSAAVRELVKAGTEGLSASVSSDGTEVIADDGRGIISLRLTGTADEKAPRRLLEGGDHAYAPEFSPDSRWFVYFTQGSGGGLYVQPFPGPGTRRQIAPSGARSPCWRQDGKEILYAQGDALMSIPVEWSTTPKFGPPRRLFSGLSWAPGAFASSRPLAVTHDGSRIFWVQGIEQPESNVIHVKTGAFDRLH